MRFLITSLFASSSRDVSGFQVSRSERVILQITILFFANNEVAHGVEKRKLRFINFVFCTKTDK
jgi:hypothetical protein